MTDRHEPQATAQRTKLIAGGRKGQHLAPPPCAQSGNVVSTPLSANVLIPATIYDRPIEHLDLSIVLFNKLRRAGIHTIGQILELDQEAFERIWVKENGLREICQRLQALNLLDLPSQEALAEPSPSVPASPALLTDCVRIPDAVYGKGIEHLDLSIRLFNLLTRAGIRTVGQLLERGPETFERIALGERSLQELVRQVQDQGFLDLELARERQASTETPEEDPTSAALESEIHLEKGWKIWTVALEAPLGTNPTTWRFAEKDQSQWALLYKHGQFPFQRGTVVRYDGALYIILAVGINTLKVRELTVDDIRFCTREELLEVFPGESYLESIQSSRRRDRRQRHGRGKLRHVASSAPITKASRVSYKVRFALLPDALRAALPRKAHYPEIQPEPIPLFAHYCYIQAFSLNEANELVEWRPEQAQGTLPDHFRVAWSPDELTDADIFKVEPAQGTPCTLQSPDESASLDLSDDTEQRLRALAEALTNPALTNSPTFVAPAYFLAGPDDLDDTSLQQMIAPGVSFPYAMQLEDQAFPRRVSLEHGQQVAIPKPVARMRVDDLKLSEKTLRLLKEAKLTTLGKLLEVEHERLVELLDASGLWELSVALFSQKALPICSKTFCAVGIDTASKKQNAKDEAPEKLTLPPASGIVAAELGENDDLGRPAHEKVYLQLSTVTYDDTERGKLTLAYASPFVNRFEGVRSGQVDTIWLTQKQIHQLMPWSREFERLDSLEARMRVSEYAVARGARPPEVKPADEEAQERDQQLQILEAKYNVVPLKDLNRPRTEDGKERPMELYISNEDMADAKAKRESETAMVLHVLERYRSYPASQPAGQRFSKRQLEDLCYWLEQDLQERQALALSSKLSVQIPCRSALVRRKEYVYQKQQVYNGETEKWEVQNVPAHVGYYVIIGVLALTKLPEELIVRPTPQKPGECTPKPLVYRTPNFVPIEERARVA